MGKQNQTNILWLRRDLQLADNISLHRALKEQGAVQPVFVFDTDILARFTNKQDRRLSFIANALVDLNNELEAKGGKLLVLYGSAREILPKLAAQAGGKIFAGEDYEPSAIMRDEYVGKNAELILSKQHVLLSPKEVLKGDGTPFKVFTPYSKVWRAKISEFDFMEYDNHDNGRYSNDFKPESVKVLDVSTEDKLCAQIGYEYVEDKIWQPGKGQEILKSFAKNRLSKYSETRDIPSGNGTSTLSPYLRFGLVTVRQAYNAAINNPDSFTWINELIWREFYAAILYHFPNTPHEEFLAQYRGLEWRDDEGDLEAWKQGKTGYPIVDAGMRQLLQDGWMHNRVRMIVASFLTKDLLIDWRLGEEHFAQYLMDYDQASNVGGWQWASSTGTDAAPYFRVFNPTLQSKRFDAKGEYIKHYVPELAGLPIAEIHEPVPIMRPASYPMPIVEHEAVKPRVMKFFKKS
jgi:deoxyribodipyrimidine photo-lyase